MDMKEIKAHVLGEWWCLMNVSVWIVLKHPSDYRIFQIKRVVWFCKIDDFES